MLLTGRIDAREEEAPKVLLNEAQPLNEGSVNALTTAEKPAASVFSDAEAAKRAPHKLYIRLDSLKGVKWPRHPRGALDLSRRHAGLSVSARHEENDARLAPSVVPAGRKHFAKITLPLERG